MKQTSIEWLFEKLWDEPKDKLTWHSILDKAKEMAQLPQQEISDEEIEKAANEHFEGDLMWSERIAFKLAIRWYREQLKQRQ